jgi:putative membrane protein
MIIEFLAHLVITSALLLLVSNIVPGLQVDGWGSAFIGALLLGLVNSFLRPLMVLLTLPLTIVTFGLFLLVVNALMLSLVAALVPGIHLRGFGSAILGSVLLSLLNLAVGAVIRRSGPGI